MALPRPPLSSGLQFPKIGDEEDQFDFSDPYGISSIDWSEGSEPPPQEEGVLGKVSSGLSTLLYPFSIPKHGVDYAARELAKSLGHETGAEDSTGQIIEESLLGKASSDAGFGEKLGRGLLTGAADLATDPLMYVGGLGILGKAGKAVGLGTKGLEYLSAVEKIAHPAFQAQMGLGVLHGVGEAVPEIYNRGLTGRAGSLLAEAGVSGAGLFGPRMLQKRAERLASEKAAEGARVQALNDMANAQLTAQDIQERMAQEGDFNEDFNNPPVPADRINALDSDVRDYRKRIDAERQRQALAPRVDQDYDYTPERANPPDPYTEGGFAALLEPPPPDPQNVGFDQLDGPLAEAPRPEIPAPRGEEVLLPPVSDLGDTSPPSPPRPSRIPGALDDLFEAEEYGRPTPGPREEGITERPFGDDTPPFYQEAPPLSYLQQDLKTKLAELERLKTTYGPHSLEYQEARANLMRQQVDLQKQVEAADQAEAAIPREPEQLSLFDESGYQRPTAAPPPSTPRGQQMELPFGEPSMGPRERPPLSPGGEQLPLPFDQGGPEPPAGMESNADFESQRAAARARAARMGLPEPEESGYAPPEEPGYAPIPEKPSLTRPVEQPAETPPPGMSRLSEIARQVNAGRPGPRDLPPPPVLDPDFIAEPPPLVTDRDYPTVETERIPRPTRPVVSEGPFGLRREAPPQQKGLFPREPPPVETTEDRISKLNAQIASLPVGHPDEVPLIAERTRLSSEVPEAPPLPKRRSGLLSGDTRLKPIQGEIPLDVAGNRILPGQENWAPEDRAAVHSRAIELAEEVVEAGRGGKDGTVLEALPWGPKAILAGLKRDKGNVIERTVHDRLLQAKIPTETAPRLVEKQLYDRAGERANSLRREIQDAAKDGKWYFYDKEGNLIELPELQELERKGRVPKGATQAWEDWWSESGRAKADADPSKESNWGAKLGITYKGRTVTGGEILEGNPSIRKQMMRAALEIERGEGVDRSRGATLAENLTRRLPTDEDTSFTPSEYEANADLGGSPRPRRSYPGYGWKLHLATDNPEAVSAILKKLGLQHKIGQSDQVGKDLTVYIGSKDDAIAAAKAISKDAGRLLKESHGETLRDDIPLAPKVAGRFDAERGRGFNQYGAKGFPLLNEDVQARVWDKENFDQGAAEARAKKALIDEHGEYFTGTEAPPTPWWRDRVSDPESAADLGVLRSRSPEGEVARRGRENETYGDMTTRTRKAYKEAERLASGVHLVDVDGDLANNPSTSFVKSEEFQPLLRAIKTASERLGKAIGSRGRFFGVNLSTDLQGLILDGEITVNPMALIARARAIAARNLREMTRRGITLTKEELDRSFRTMFFDIAGKKILHTLAHEHAHTIEGTKTPTGVSHTIAHKRAMQDAARGVKDSYHELTAAIKNAMTTIAPDLYATKKMDSGSPADLYKKFKFDKDEARKVALEGRANAGANRGSRNNEGLPGGQFGPEPPAQRGGGPTGGDLASGRGVGNTGRPEGTLRRGGERGEGLLGGGRGGARSTAPGLGGSDSTARGAEAGRGLAQQADLAKGEANQPAPIFYSEAERHITPQMKNSMPMFERDRPTSSTEGPAYSPLESNEGPALTPDEKAMLRKRGVEPPDIPERPEGETPPEQRVRTKPAQDALRNTVGPKVEQNVEKLRLAEMRGGLSPAKLDRETVKTIASMDKKALQTLLSEDGDYYLNRAARGQISVPDTIAWEARLRTLEEDAHERWTKFKEAEAIGTDPTEIKRLRQDFDIANESHWEERAAKINLGSLKGSALQAESVHSPSSPSSPSAFLSKIIRELDLTPKQAAGLNAIYLEDPLLLGDAIRTIRNPSLFRKLLEGQKGGMVSAISTNVANASGNIGEFAAKLGETYTSAVAENVISKSKIRRPVQEVKAELGGALRYAKPALRRLGQAIKEIALLAPEKVDLTHSLDYAGGMIGKGGRAVEALNKATGKNFHLGRAVRSPLRMLMAVDEFFKTVGGGAETAKLAYQAASRELGAKAGHSEVKALAKTIELEIGDLSTARGIDLARKVAQAKLERTFQESPIEIVQSFNVMRNKHPWLNLVVPFTTTPANILRRVWQRSPAGFVKVAKEYRAGKFNGDSAAFAEALARPILGTAIFGGFVAAAQSGLMTGSGPSDPDDLNLLKSTGWQPYSLVIENDNGTQSYIPFNRFEPISSLLSIAADWGTLSEVKQEEQGERVLGSLLSNMVSKTYLRGLSDAAMMISKPKEAGGQFLRSVAGTVVPNIVTKTGKAFDPTVYDTKPTKKGFASIPQGMANQIIADTPGLAGKYLQPRRDKFGKIIESPGGPIGRALSPFPITTSKPNAPLVKELIRVGVSLPSPKNTLRADGVEVSLNPRELELIQSGQQELESALTKLTKTPAYKYLADTREEAGSKSKEAYIRRAIDSIQRRTRDKIMKNSDFHRRFLSSRRKALSTREAL